MNKKSPVCMSATIAAVALGIVFFASSCVVRTHGSAQAVYETQEAPPVPQYRIPATTRQGYVWQRGKYERIGNTWRWREGRWARSRANRHWHPGDWHQQGSRYIWVSGQWLDQPAVYHSNGSLDRSRNPRVYGPGTGPGTGRDTGYRQPPYNPPNTGQGSVYVGGPRASGPNQPNNQPHNRRVVNPTKTHTRDGRKIVRPTAQQNGVHPAARPAPAPTTDWRYPTNAPPPPRTEAPGTRVGYVFIPGHHRWEVEDRKYKWVAGHWERSRPASVWLPGRWENRGGRYVWVEGQWARQ